jgi:small subunit ribosomal protein S21
MSKHNFIGNRIKGRTVSLRDGDDVQKALRKLKKKMEESKVLEEVRKREYYEKPTTKRKRAQAAAKARYRKKLEKEQLPKKNW